MSEKILGKCPICKEGDILAKDKLYVCSNSKTEKNEDSGEWEEKGSCSYKIFKTALKKFNPRYLITEKDIKELLEKGTFIATLVSGKSNNEYKKYVEISPDYGVKINFDKDIKKEEE